MALWVERLTLDLGLDYDPTVSGESTRDSFSLSSSPSLTPVLTRSLK